MTYLLRSTAQYGQGGAGLDNGVRLTGKSYSKGVVLTLACDDYGGGPIPPRPDFDFDDKIVEVFFPLAYDTDFNQVKTEPARALNPPTVTIYKMT
jgi:hypothetical protein